MHSGSQRTQRRLEKNRIICTYIIFLVLFVRFRFPKCRSMRPHLFDLHCVGVLTKTQPLVRLSKIWSNCQNSPPRRQSARQGNRQYDGHILQKGINGVIFYKSCNFYMLLSEKVGTNLPEVGALKKFSFQNWGNKCQETLLNCNFTYFPGDSRSEGPEGRWQQGIRVLIYPIW